MTNAIEIHGVTKTFGPKTAVKDLDLVIPEHALYAFIGPNGAGKTTTIRMIMSILFPDKGEISVLGKASAVESKDRIGYLPEERGLYKKMKVGSFLNYMGRLKGMDAGPLDKTVKDWLVRMGLAETYRKKCEELSKGMQQKVQFIAAVIHKPDLIILDEPFSGLDPVNRKLLRDLIDQERQRGCTLIFSTHAMAALKSPPWRDRARHSAALIGSALLSPVGCGAHSTAVEWMHTTPSSTLPEVSESASGRTT